MQIKDYKNVLQNYYYETPAIRSNIFKILNTGKLSGTGKLIILPVDQGFEHGPEKSFSMNPDAYNPHYHYNLAIETGLSAFAAPVGILENCANLINYGEIPTILKINSSNSLFSSKISFNQSITSSIDDALRLGCCGIGFTIYPGSNNCHSMINQISELSRRAKQNGLIVVIWSYPRGEGVDKKDETSMDVISYASHIASLIGAHIVKVKIPDNKISNNSLKIFTNNIESDLSNKSNRIKLIMRSCFCNQKIVLFSGGASKGDESLIEDVQAIKNGGGSGSIIGRNVFQRSKSDAEKIIDKLISIYKE